MTDEGLPCTCTEPLTLPSALGAPTRSSVGGRARAQGGRPAVVALGELVVEDVAPVHAERGRLARDRVGAALAGQERVREAQCARHAVHLEGRVLDRAAVARDPQLVVAGARDDPHGLVRAVAVVAHLDGLVAVGRREQLQRRAEDVTAAVALVAKDVLCVDRCLRDGAHDAVQLVCRERLRAGHRARERLDRVGAEGAVVDVDAERVVLAVGALARVGHVGVHHLGRARLHERGGHRVAARGLVVAVGVPRAHDEHRVLARECLGEAGARGEGAGGVRRARQRAHGEGAARDVHAARLDVEQPLAARRQVVGEVVRAVAVVDEGAEHRLRRTGQRHGEEVAAHVLRVAVAVGRADPHPRELAGDGDVRVVADHDGARGAARARVDDRGEGAVLDVLAVHRHRQPVGVRLVDAVLHRVQAVARVEHLHGVRGGGLRLVLRLRLVAVALAVVRLDRAQHRRDRCAAAPARVLVAVARAHLEVLQLARDAALGGARPRLGAEHERVRRVGRPRLDERGVRAAIDVQLVEEHVNGVDARGGGLELDGVHAVELVAHRGRRGEPARPVHEHGEVADYRGGGVLLVAVGVLGEDVKLVELARRGDLHRAVAAEGHRVARARVGGQRLHGEGGALDGQRAEGDLDLVEAGDGHRVLDDVRAVRGLAHEAMHAGAAAAERRPAQRHLEVVAAHGALVAEGVGGDDDEGGGDARHAQPQPVTVRGAVPRVGPPGQHDRLEGRAHDVDAAQLHLHVVGAGHLDHVLDAVGAVLHVGDARRVLPLERAPAAPRDVGGEVIALLEPAEARVAVRVLGGDVEEGLDAGGRLDEALAGGHAVRRADRPRLHVDDVVGQPHWLAAQRDRQLVDARDDGRVRRGVIAVAHVDDGGVDIEAVLSDEPGAEEVAAQHLRRAVLVVRSDLEGGRRASPRRGEPAALQLGLGRAGPRDDLHQQLGARRRVAAARAAVLHVVVLPRARRGRGEELDRQQFARARLQGGLCPVGDIHLHRLGRLRLPGTEHLAAARLRGAIDALRVGHVLPGELVCVPAGILEQASIVREPCSRRRKQRMQHQRGADDLAARGRKTGQIEVQKRPVLCGGAARPAHLQNRCAVRPERPLLLHIDVLTRR
eukprot:scaffold56606_cov69-Phaeocystis_antarctica.AAC.1